jgi:WD40 repeat protein
MIALKFNTLLGHSGALYALEEGPEPGTLFSGGGDGVVTLWNLDTCQNLPFQARFPSAVFSICYVREKHLLLVGTSSGSIHILDLYKKEEVKILQHHTAQVFNILYSILLDSFYSVSADGNFAVCSLQSLSLIKIKKLSEAKLRQMDIQESSSSLAIASGDGRILMMDLQSLELKTSFQAHGSSVNTVRFHPSKPLLLSGGKDAHLNVWDLDHDFKQIHSIPAHNFALYDIRFSPDMSYFATASRDKTVKLFDAQDFQFRLRIDKAIQGGHSNSVNALSWPAWPGHLVSAGDDRSLLLWQID